MTYQNFMDRVEDYFGFYPEKSRVPSYVLAYLKRDIDEGKLNILFRYLSYSHPVNYGPPDIAAFEAAILWGLKNNKGSDVHKVKVGESVPFEQVDLTDEEVALCDEMMEDLKTKVCGMSMEAREERVNHRETA